MQCLVRQNMKERSYSALCIFFIFLISFLFVLTARSQCLITYSDYTDSSVFQYIARMILNGAVPYRDTFDHKGPFLYFLNTLALWISPEHGIWVIELINMFLFFLLIYFLVRLFCKKITSILVVFTIIPLLCQYFEGGNLVEEYALPFITGALYIFSDYFLNQRITRLRLFLCGVSLGAVLLLRINMIAIWIVMSIGVLVQCISRRNYKQIFFFLGYFVFGLLTFIAPFIIWLSLHGGLKDCWNDYILFNFLYSSDGRRANIYAKINAFFAFLHTKWMMIAVTVVIISCFKKKDLLNALYLLCLLVTLLLICISGQTYGHYGMVLIPILAIPMAYIGQFFDDSWNNKQFCNIFIIICLLISAILPTWHMLINNAIISYQHRGSSQIDPTVATISSWLKENTLPEEQIIVCGNWNDIYNQSNRFAASQYSYQFPICSISADMEIEFFEEIARDKPAAIILPNDFYAHDQMLQFIDTHHYIRVHNDKVDNNIALYLSP